MLIATFALLALAAVFFFRSSCDSQAGNSDEVSSPTKASVPVATQKMDAPHVREAAVVQHDAAEAVHEEEQNSSELQDSSEEAIKEALARGVRLFMSARYDEALPLVEPAAHAGHLRAQQIMAKMYYAGHGVAQDKEQYFFWLKQAADNGDKPSKIKVKKIESAQG